MKFANDNVHIGGKNDMGNRKIWSWGRNLIGDKGDKRMHLDLIGRYP